MEKIDNVHVVIRVRPLINTEQSSNEIIHWKVQDNTISQSDADSQKKAYTFDRVFPPSSSSVEVFDEVAQPVLDAVMEGYNGTIFAYGQTSSGKTHTMMGTDTDLGVIPRVAKALFEAIEKTPLRKFLLRVSYMEIYNERVFDLLGVDKKQRNVREDMNGKTFVENLEEEFVGNCEDLLGIMKKGELNRSYGSTRANENSSRSHTIFTLTVESACNQEDGEGIVNVSQLNLVDLAGSERVSQSHSIGERFREGCAINTSLFTLRKVIKGLSQADGQFICFRDSKLTRILQPSLGGNAKTSIICTVTPAMVDETHSTLQFASTAKTVRVKPTVNEVLSDEALLKRYTKEIESLQKKLESRSKTENNQELKKMKLELQEKTEQNQLLAQQLSKLQERIVTSSLNIVPSEAIAKLNQNYRRLTWGGRHLSKMLSQEILKDSLTVPLAAIQSSGRSSDGADDAECFIPGKKVRFERRFSDDCLVVTNDVACQVTLTNNATQVDSTEWKVLKSQVECLVNEKITLLKKLATLKVDLRTERASRILAEKRQNADTTFQFLKEENSVQDEEIKNLKLDIAALTKSSSESEALLKIANSKLALENSELQKKFAELEQKLNDASTQFHSEQLHSQKELQNQLDLARKKIEKLSMELKDVEIQYEHNHKHADVVKTELRQQLQAAYDRIDYLEHNNACLDVSKLEVHTKELGDDKSIHELTLGSKDFSKLFNKLPKTSAKQSTSGIDYDSEMQIVQMEFELREAAHLENIKIKECRIEELANQVEETAKQHANMLQEVEDLKTSIKQAHSKEGLLIAELEKAKLNCQAPVQELNVEEWESRQCEMLKKIADLEEEITNYKNASSLSQPPHVTNNSAIPEAPGEYLEMNEKIDALLRILEEFGQKEKSYIAEHPLGEDLNFRKHLKESQAYQEELQKKVEDLRKMVVQFKQKEQHVLGELEGLKAELKNRESFGNSSTSTQTGSEEVDAQQSNKITEMSKLIKEMKQKEQHLVEKLENLEDHIRQEGANNERDVEGELIEMREKNARLELDIMEYKQREEALSVKSPCVSLAMEYRDASTETELMSGLSWLAKTDDVSAQISSVAQAENYQVVKNEIDQLRAELADSETLLRNLESEKTNLRRESEAAVRMLQDKNNELEVLKAEHRSKLQEYETTNIDYQNKLKEIETCKTEYHTVIEEFEKFRLEHDNKLAEFNAVTEDLKSQLASYETAESDAALKVREAEAKQAETERQLKEYEHRILDGKEMEDRLSAELKDMQNAFQRQGVQAEEETLKLTTTKKQLEQTNEEMAATIMKHVQSESAYLEELGILRKFRELHKECEDKIKELQIEVAQSTQREKQLRQYTQTLECDANSKSDGRYRELLDELNSIREREIQLRKALKEKEANQKDVQQQVHRYEENMDSLQQQLYDLKNELDVLQMHIVEMEENEAVLQGKVEAGRKLRDKLQTEFVQKDKEMQRMVEMAEIRASDLQIECEEMKKQYQKFQNLKLHNIEGRSVGVQCRLVRNPVAVKTAGTQVQGSLLGEASTEAKMRASSVNAGTQCNLVGHSNLLKDCTESKQNLWSFTFTRGIQCELLTDDCISKQKNESLSNSWNQTIDSTVESSVKVKPQIRDEEFFQLIAKLEAYEKENANLVHDIREVRGTLHEHSESKRTMQNKISSLEENLGHKTEKCEQLKAEIRRLNSMKNMSMVGVAASRKQSEDEDTYGSNAKYVHSGSSMIIQDNAEELQIELQQLKTKYEKLKALYIKQTNCVQRTRKVVGQSPKHRMPSAANLRPEVKVSKLSSNPATQDVIENKPPENKKPLSDQRGNVGLPFSGHIAQEVMTGKMEPFSSTSRATDLRRYLRSDHNAAYSSSKMNEEDDNCTVS